MKTLAMLCSVCFLLPGQVFADSYFTLSVNQGDGEYSIAQGWSDHSQDTIFDTVNYSLDRPWVALDKEATKYTTLGPKEETGEWSAYAWAGYHMAADTPYNLSVEAYAPINIACVNFDGAGMFQTTLLAGEQYAYALLATPATANQWRTKGYHLIVSPVPEPSSCLVLISTLIGFVALRQRKI